MPTLEELVGATPAPTRGVPAGFTYGAGEWRHVVEIADPGLGAAVAWHDLTAIDGVFTGYDYTRGSDGYFGRYRASVVTLDLYADGDALAPWNDDTSATFGTHLELGPGLLIRSGFIRVAGGVVDSWNPRFTCKVESWGDASYSRGKVRQHRVVARDLLSSLVGVPLPARTAENWFERFVWIVAGSGWPYGWFAYGARHQSDLTTPILLLPDRPASSSAVNELDATLDPAGLCWYTDRQGRLVVRPRVNDTFHAAAFTAGADGTPWVDAPSVDFAWFACLGGPATEQAAYAVDTPGIDPFGFDETDRWVINHVKVTDPTGPGFDDDDPTSIQRFDRKTLQAQWIAPNDTVAADLLASRSFATVEARPLHTSLALENFHPGPARIEYLGDVAIVHRNTDVGVGLEVGGYGWLRSYQEQVRPQGCDTDWSLSLIVDIYATASTDAFLLPVEDLTLVDVTDTTAEFSWTNPAQTIEPTHTQIRLINPASLWATVEYPLTGLTWSGLTPETGYEFQVRLIRIDGGITTHFSAIRAVSFVTLETTVPVVDDGDVDLPDPDPDCEVFWELVSSPDGTDPWTVEDSGTITEPPFELPDYDFSLLDPALWYRFQSREVCDEVPGALQVGDVFVVDCVGSDRLEVPPFDDENLVAYWPEFCPNGVISELVTGAPMIKGPALTRVDTVDDLATLVSSGGLVGYQVMESSPAGSHDLTIGCRILVGTPPATETTVFEYGGAWISIVADDAAPDPDAAGFRINANIQRGGGVYNTVEGTTVYGLNTPYRLTLIHDPGLGDVFLFVDAVVEASAIVAFGDRATFGQMSTSLPSGSWITDMAAWAAAVIPTIPAVEVVGVGTAVWALSGSGSTALIPAGAAVGDLLVLHLTARDDLATFTGLTSWTSLARGTHASEYVSQIYTRPMVAGVTGATWTPSVFTWHGGYIVALRGAGDISTVQQTTSATTTTPLAAPAFTAPAGDLVMSFIGWRYGSTPTSMNLLATTVPPWTQIIATIYPGPNAQAMGSAWAAGTGSPVAPAATWEYGGTTDSRSYIIHQFSVGIAEPPEPPVIGVFTGGTVTTSGGYKYHTFTTSGTLTCVTPGDVEYFVVAGGGGGENVAGGGAGGVVTGSMLVSSNQTVTVGAGGVGATTVGAAVTATKGSDSSFGAVVALGGGYGQFGNGDTAGADGGSGGGGGYGASTPGAGTSEQGHAGGTGAGNTANNTVGGGGGGAGGAGGNAPTSKIPGDGGMGIEWPAGSGVLYAGGGGGGAWNGTSGGAGGSGGGGAGKLNNGSGPGVAGTNGKGAGGGGGGYNTGYSGGGAGGSGVVIVRYPEA